MRAFLNSILAFIGAASLSDGEFDSLTIDSAAYNADTYNALAGVLSSREAVSTLQDKLVAYFKAKGADVVAYNTGKTNIFLGAVL